MTTTPALVKVAQHLRAIEDMHARLLDHAQAHAKTHPGGNDLPGGEAMAQLGPVANLEAWESRQQATERYARAYTSAPDEDPDEAWSAFQTLRFWSEDWRRERGADYEMVHTVATEAAFLRECLAWAWEQEPHWDEFAADVDRARVRLENLLREGERADRSRVTCTECDSAPQLIKVWADRLEADEWKCPACKRRYTEEQRYRAFATQLRSEGADRYVTMPDVRGVFDMIGRARRTVVKWFEPGEEVVRSHCDVATRTTWVWWPDVWRRHLSTRERNRAA